MRGKLIFVAGLATGYVLGSRAGRARYEQIKKNWLKVWETDAVQDKVEIAQDFAKSRASELPKALFTGVKKVTDAINGEGGKKSDATEQKPRTSTSTPASTYTPPIPGQTDTPGTSTPGSTN